MSNDYKNFDSVQEVVNYLEDEYEITVLSIRDYGSNAWNLDSETSDMDAGMVYRHEKTSSYVKLGTYRQNIDRTFILDGEEFELIGWNIDRFAELLNKSNPSMIEWLNSDIHYYNWWVRQGQGSVSKVKDADTLFDNPQSHANENFKPIALWGHYRDMGKANYRKHIENRNDLSVKRHLYILRGLTYARYVLETHQRPPLDFVDFYENHLPELDIDETVYQYIGELIRRKKNGDKNEELADEQLWQWMADELDKEVNHSEHDVRIDREEINNFIDKVLP